ncbi:MAG: alpha/beta hydrolase fold domain-containing protein [Phycisphaerae bacterium]|jgi:acetyl esterase/lipase
MFTRAVPAYLLASLAAVSAAHAQAYQTIANIPYGDGDARQVLDIHRPTAPSAALRPVVLWIHGGVWRAGDKAMLPFRINALVARGFVVASTNYRLTGTDLSPAQIHDCKAAVRFLRANASQYGIDPNRIGVWGLSAGGHLVAHLGVSSDVPEAEGTVGPHDGVSSRVQAVANYFGPADFFDVPGWAVGEVNGVSNLLGFPLEDAQANVNNPDWADEVALARLTQVVTHVTSDDAPMYLAHGTADTVVFPQHSQNLFALLQAAGVPSTLRLVLGAGHGLPATEDAAAIDFLVRALAPCAADRTGDGRIDMPICDCVDFNGNSVFPEDQDVIAYLDVLAGAACDACADIDFNNSGVFPEDRDIVDFFRVLAGGNCPA